MNCNLFNIQINSSLTCLIFRKVQVFRCFNNYRLLHSLPNINDNCMLLNIQVKYENCKQLSTWVNCNYKQLAHLLAKLYFLYL